MVNISDVNILSSIFCNKTNILYITYANITNFGSSKSGGFVPEAKIWKGCNLIRCPYELQKIEP